MTYRHRYDDNCTCPTCTKRWRDALLKALDKKPKKVVKRRAR